MQQQDPKKARAWRTGLLIDANVTLTAQVGGVSRSSLDKYELISPTTKQEIECHAVAEPRWVPRGGDSRGGIFHVFHPPFRGKTP